MSDKLTPKQESFCQKYIECGNASEAYRHAYDAENMKPESVHRMAHDVLENLKVSSRLEQLRSKHMKKHEVTVEKVIGILEEALAMAKDKEDPTNVRGAGMDMAKLCGLIIDKQHVTGELEIDKKRGEIAKRFAARVKKDGPNSQ